MTNNAHKYKHYIDLSQLEEIAVGNGALEAKYMLLLITYARELEERNKQLEARVKELEIRDVSATHMIMDADFKKHEMSLRIADLERQLAEATILNHRMNYEFYGDQFLACLPWTKKEDV